MRIFIPIVFLAALFDCSQPPEAPPPAVRAENPVLGIALASVGDGFELETNEGETLELVRNEGLPAGRAWFEIGPKEEHGINLVEIVKAQRQSYESLPNGSFSGNRELVMPDGRPAYYSRGRFEDGGRLVEEFRISSLHPSWDRLLQVFYRYPAAEDSADRLNDLLLLIGEIEALSPSTEPDS